MLANIIVSQMAIFMRVRSVKGHICVNFMSTFIVFNSLNSADVNGHLSAPYLAGVLGVPEHPRNLGVQKGAKPDFCLSEFSYYILRTPPDLKS